MENFVEQVMQLDASGDHYGILRLAASERDRLLPWNIYRLLSQNRFFEAFMTAKLLIGTGSRNPVTYLAQALGGLLFGSPDDVHSGATWLRTLTDQLQPEQVATLATKVVQPAIRHVVLSNASIVHNHDFALSVLEVLIAGQPDFRDVFDIKKQLPPWNRETVARKGRESARLLTFPVAPAGKSRRTCRAVMAVRKLVFPQNPDSRLLDVGPRIGAAMQAYGWQPTFCPLQFRGPLADFQSIIECCEQTKAELLILDDYYILDQQLHPIRNAILARLRASLPKIRIIALHLDPWEVPPAMLASTVTTVDFVWTPFPSMSVWNEPVFANKMIYLPLPNAGTSSLPTTKLSGEMGFIGSIFSYNWHRVFWLAAAKRLDLPVRFELSNHSSDGLSVLDSYRAYIRAVEATGCALNFSMRPDLSKVITGRTFEAILAGALLAQEANPDMDYYFISGEHYLAFSTLPELRAIARFIADCPEEAEDIRKAGNAYARLAYDDATLIGHLDKRLFLDKESMIA